jgi:hypothetical protein
VEGTAPYKVRVYDATNNKILVQTQPKTNRLILNANKLILGKMYYVVERPIEYGFRAYSKKTPFGFSFLAPQLTSPEKNAALDARMLLRNENTIFFTWTKTNYTASYEFEISSDENFQNLYLKKELKDNFHTLVAPPAGTYFWRVRSNASGMFSSFSEVRTLKISSN